MKTASPTKTVPAKKAATGSRKTPAAKPLNGTSCHDPISANSHVPTLQDQIAARAYHIWQQQGCPDGSHERNWSQAEQEITHNEPAAFIP